MIDIQLIRENSELVKENIKKKFQDSKLPLVDKVKELDEKWRKLKFDEDKLRSDRNKVSKEISELKKQKKNADNLLEEAKQIPTKIEKIQETRKKLETQINEIMSKIPNIIHDSVPLGKDDSENKEVKKIGTIKEKNFEVINHAELAEKLGVADFNTAGKTSGNGFYYLKGDLARLEAAIINFARDYMVEKNYEYILPPFMIRSNVVDGVMSFEEKDAMMYKIQGEDLYLIGTSEHSLIGMFTDKVLNGKELPIKLTGYSACFRKEVGSHGLDEKGIYRVHQFNKQEMVVICEPEDSYKLYEEMINYTIEVFKQMEIPIRRLECCSGDLADLKAKSEDIEAWSPRQKKYFEVGSCSNLTDAQARRLNIKIEKNGKRYFAHTLNNTVVATSRALVAILENHQNKDGTVNIPKVLQPYMGGLKKIQKKK